MADRSFFDQNNRNSLIAVSNADGITPVSLWADPTTHALILGGSLTITGVATSANQTGGNQKTQIVDGSGNVIGSSGNALNVNVSSATVSGNLTNNNAAPAATNIGSLVALANAAAPSYSEGKQVLLSTDLSGALRVSGSISVGGTTDNSAFTAGTSTGTTALGFYHSTIDTVTDGRAAALAIDSKRNLFTVLRDAAGNARGANVNASNQLSVSVDNNLVLGAGASLIGKVGIDQTTPGTTNAVSLAQLGATTVSTGNGLSGAGVLRVAIASDNTAFSVNATLSAETTKVIGTVNQGTSPWVVNTSSATGGSVPANAFYIAGLGASGNLVGFKTSDAIGDGSSTGLIITPVYNGTNYDRMRSANAASATTGTGLLGVGILAFDGTNYQRVGALSNNNAAPSVSNLGVLPAIATNQPQNYTNGNQVLLATDLSGNLKTAIISRPSEDLGFISGAPVVTSQPGIQVNTLADDMGNTIGSFQNRLNVHVRGMQDAVEDSIPTLPYFTSALTNSLQLVRTGRTNLYNLHIINTGAANAFVQIFDVPLGTTVTLGTTTPLEVWFIPAGGAFEETFTVPPSYINSFQIAATTTATGNSAPGTALVASLRTSP